MSDDQWVHIMCFADRGGDAAWYINGQRAMVRKQPWYRRLWNWLTGKGQVTEIVARAGKAAPLDEVYQ